MISNSRGLSSVIVAVLFSLFGLAACSSGSDSEPVAAVADGSAAEPAVAPVATQGPGDVSAVKREVIVETLPYAETADQLVYADFAFPADMVEPIPAVILIHDRWGLNDAIRDQARKLAAEGYIVMAIDLFGGAVADTPASARDLEIAVFENPELAAESIREAYQFLRGTFGAPSVASVGFGFGGGWSLNAAMLLPNELSASVNFYGQVTSDQEKLALVEVPIQGLFAEDDRVIPTRNVFAFEVALDSLGKESEIEIFAGVGRGFVDPGADRYDAEKAALAWQQMLNFLERHMVANSD
jgi:carboxymethylenebutenolidase